VDIEKVASISECSVRDLGRCSFPELVDRGGPALIAILLLALAVYFRNRRQAAIVFAVLAVFAGIWSVLMMVVHQEDRWRWLLSSLPALIIMNHAVFLFLIRSQVVPANPAGARQALERRRETRFLADVLDQASKTSVRYFSIEALMIRYFIPAVFVGGLCVGVSNLLVWPDPRLPAEALTGAKYGLAGAYTYVLLYLGQRSFRHDITAGAATWAAITLAVGPVLAGTLGMFAPVPPPSAAVDPNGLGRGSLLFIAGFSPRFVAAFIEGAVRRLYQAPISTENPPPRTIPIRFIRGISAQVEERLAEEGIEDASMLGMADPIRLLRNTSFDKRQIVRWIDAALLLVALPEHWRELEKHGITGAIDLARYARAGADPGAEGSWPDAPASDAPGRKLEEIAGVARIDGVILRHASERLWQDAQVRLIWLLYQLEGDTEEPGAEPQDAGTQPTPAT
jgi:hypothetical protein